MAEPGRFKVGDRVVKDPAAWRPSEFDAWGAGVGVGAVLDVLADGTLDVRWPAGRCWQRPEELRPAPEVAGG